MSNYTFIAGEVADAGAEMLRGPSARAALLQTPGIPFYKVEELCETYRAFFFTGVEIYAAKIYPVRDTDTVYLVWTQEHGCNL